MNYNRLVPIAFFFYCFVVTLPVYEIQAQNTVSARYSFENTLNDLSGNGNHAEGKNIGYAEGKTGRGIQLDGNSYVRIPYSSNVHFKDKLTVEMWIN